MHPQFPGAHGTSRSYSVHSQKATPQLAATTHVSRVGASTPATVHAAYSGAGAFASGAATYNAGNASYGAYSTAGRTLTPGYTTGQVTTQHTTTTTKHTSTGGAYGTGGVYATGYGTTGGYSTGGYTSGAAYTNIGTSGVAGAAGHTTRSKSVPFPGESVQIGDWLAPAGAKLTDTRLVSSSVVHEETIGHIPPMEVREVEVTGQREEKVSRVSRREVREVERRVPKVEIEYVEKIVEVPKIEYVQKMVEVPQVQEVVTHVPKIEIVDRPYEVIKEVPRIETKVVEKIIEIPEIIEVPKPYVVENKVSVPRYVDEDSLLIVDQQVVPTISLSDEVVEVDVVEYVAEPIPVEVHVAKMTNMAELAMVDMHTQHKVVSVPTGQYNSMLQYLNGHISQYQQFLPYMQENGTVPLLSTQIDYKSVPSTAEVEGYRRGMVHCRGQAVACATTLDGIGEAQWHAIRAGHHGVITEAQIYNNPAFYARWGNGQAVPALQLKHAGFGYGGAKYGATSYGGASAATYGATAAATGFTGGYAGGYGYTQHYSGPVMSTAANPGQYSLHAH